MVGMALLDRLYSGRARPNCRLVCGLWCLGERCEVAEGAMCSSGRD